MITIVNYRMGNIRSVQNALDYLCVSCQVTSDPKTIIGATRLILPGVGSFHKAMENLNQMNLIEPLHEVVKFKNRPVLGICLGMQLLADSGDEDGPSEGLGWISGNVRKIKTTCVSKIPHIGFNTALFSSHNRILFNGLREQADFYFVHSYVFDCNNDSLVSSWTEYGEKFASAIHDKNIFGTQFHPEKSQSNGLLVLKNFISFEI